MGKLDFHCTVDDPFKVAKVAMAIGECDTLSDLDKVAKRIAVSDFTSEDLKILRFLWKDRRADIDASGR